MMLPGKQINALLGQSAWHTGGILPATGTTLVVSSHFAGKTAGGTDSVAGVFTTTPQNRISLRRTSDGKVLDSGSATQVFARLSYSAGVWTLTFYTQVTGVESAFNWSGHTDAGAAFDYRWCEALQIAQAAPTAIVDTGDGADGLQEASPLLHTHGVPDTLTISTNGQTALVLAAVPKFSQCSIYVNGHLQTQGTGKDYTVAGSAVAWLNRHFTLATTDEVVAVYEV